MSRFIVGKKYPFLRHKVWVRDLSSERKSISNSLYPFENDTISTQIEYLTCIEEHEVPNEYGEGVSKGYSFILEGFEAHFTNQYPFAQYSQMSTEADWVVSAIFEKNGETQIDEYISAHYALNQIERAGKNGAELPDYLRIIKDTILASLKDNGCTLKETDLSLKASEALGYKCWKNSPAA
ncbi:hypothetical protein QXB71_003639 [Vibrio cholerae]|nr:hypothetical protein [Vibrio cholerae]EJL6709913.1 hypothetical protein [Vibrio cholerae]ELO1828383.1 hypothetical protein [Vibrio cholerae]